MMFFSCDSCKKSAGYTNFVRPAHWISAGSSGALAES
jgi:hypothetical protein